jgi:hypothetical protein
MTITFKQFLTETESPIDFVQKHIVDNYNKAANKNFKAEEVQVTSKKWKKSVMKECFNNSYRYILLNDDVTESKYVLGYVLVHGIPLEHAWVHTAEGHVDVTLETAGHITGYIKVTELPFKEVCKFVNKHKFAPSLYDVVRHNLKSE